MIKTTYDPPAIPCRDFDWQATFENINYELPGCMEPGSDPDTGEHPVEFAETEEEAIRLLLDNHL